MNAPHEQAKFLSGNLTKHIISMSLTAAMGFIALFLVDLADMLFISMLGIEELAAGDLIFLFCGPLSLAWIFNGIIFVANAAYNNLGHPFCSTWVNWGRNTLGIVPFVYFGAQYWGAEGVLIGQMLGGVFVAIVSFLLAERIMRGAERDHILSPTERAFSKYQSTFKILHHRR